MFSMHMRQRVLQLFCITVFALSESVQSSLNYYFLSPSMRIWGSTEDCGSSLVLLVEWLSVLNLSQLRFFPDFFFRSFGNKVEKVNSVLLFLHASLLSLPHSKRFPIKKGLCTPFAQRGAWITGTKFSDCLHSFCPFCVLFLLQFLLVYQILIGYLFVLDCVAVEFARWRGHVIHHA